MKKIVIMLTALLTLVNNACYAYVPMGRVFPEDLRDYDYSSGGGGGSDSPWIGWGALLVFMFFQFLDCCEKGGVLRGIRDALFVPTLISAVSLPLLILSLLYNYGPDKWYEWLALIAAVVIVFKVGKKLLLPKSK